MLGRFFKKSYQVEAVPQTFKQRADLFWQWFAGHADAFYQAIENKNFDPHLEEVTGRMNELFPGIAWCFGPGENNVGHSFTLSPEGDPYKALLLTHVLKQAPSLKGWTFYDSRQSSPDFSSMSMNIAGKNITAKEIWVAPSVDQENECIDLVCWAPVFDGLSVDERGQIVFLWLDEAIGEFQVTNRIGCVDIEATDLQSAIALSELPEYIADTEKQHGWERKTSGEYYTGYRMRERKDFEPEHSRSNIFAGTSLLHELSRDFARAHGEMDHPLPGLGVDYLFVKIPGELFTPGHEIDERAEIEDVLESSFGGNSLGIVLGGAAGRGHMYIDLVILDGENSIQALKQGLSQLDRGRAAKVYYFDKERAGRAI